jgi:flagellar biosynthesis GTPase FlhF
VARLAELDQLQAKLEDEQQALEQGFGAGFNAAFQSVDQNISQLIAKSQEFGQAGFDAALRLQEGIAAAQEQARDGILNAEAFNAEVQRQQELFNQELANIQEAEKARDAAAEDRKAKEQERANAELKAQDDYRKQQETALQAYQQQQQQAQQQYAQEQARIFEEQRKAAEAEAKRQEERIRKLNTLGAQSVNVADIRNVESANLVLQLGANAQDPALIQQRLQTKLLEKIAVGIGQAASNYFNQPVAIVGYADVGGI